MKFLETLKNNAGLLSVDLLGTPVAKTKHRGNTSSNISSKQKYHLIVVLFSCILISFTRNYPKTIEKTSNICLLIRCFNRCIKMAGNSGLLDVQVIGTHCNLTSFSAKTANLILMH